MITKITAPPILKITVTQTPANTGKLPMTVEARDIEDAYQMAMRYCPGSEARIVSDTQIQFHENGRLLALINVTLHARTS